jgi:serine/threonine-protein kinase
VERYELLAELAAGGMATVFLARLGGAGGFQRLVAIKRLHPHLAHEREFVEMFLDEARLAARIHHPNVVPILEVGTSDVGYFLVMEYIEGETLARLLGRTASRGEKIPTRVAVKIVLDTLAGLEAAHGLRDDFGEPLRIVHRDVSPQNVMVGVDGTSRITDFGVARAATRLTTTRAGQLKGKLGYMAPEQAQGDDIDLRADVFAVGVILWECLAGRRLFKGKADASDAQTLNRLLYEPIPTLRDTDPTVHEAFGALTQRALERDVSRRFASCGEFAEALEKVAEQTGGIASTREVAAFVDSVAGPEIEAQRDAVRNWVARSEVSLIERTEEPMMKETPSFHTSPFELASPHRAAVAEVSQTQGRDDRSRTALILLSVFGLGGAVAAASFAVYYLTRQVEVPPPEPSAASTVNATAVPVVASAPPATPDGSAVPAASERIPAVTATNPRVEPTASTGRSRPGDQPVPTVTTAPPADTTAPPDDLTTNPYR